LAESDSFFMNWKGIARDLIPPVIMRALRPMPRSGGYISANTTVAAAQAAGLSVCDYVERLWGTKGQTASIIEKIHDLGAISSATKTIVEIGPGTGRYIEHTLKYCCPNRYQIYEIDSAWSSWLAQNYPIEACAADGQSLKSTTSNSVDLIQAHGVFVYLPFLTSYRYFKEIIRVAAPGSFVILDIISERCMEPQTVERWLQSGHVFPCFLSTTYVGQIFEKNGFRFVEDILSPYGVGWSEYLVFTRIGRRHHSAGVCQVPAGRSKVGCR
jgi:Methyltransferase domain